MREIKREDIWAALAGTVPVTWLALRIAPYWTGNLFEMMAHIERILAPPLYRFLWTPWTLKVVLFCLFAYVVGIGVWFSMRKNYRRGEEHGSAKWGDAHSVNRKYAQRPLPMNKILTQHVRIGFDAHKHKRNLNVLVVGGSGSGKTRFYVKPNVLQANCSLVLLDPKGELIRSTGYMLMRQGYKIKVLDLIDMGRSHCYNPFVYLRDDNDVQRLVTNLFKSTTPKGAQSMDPFWDNAAQMLLMALILYLKHEAPEDEQNFAMVMDMIRAGDVDEDDSKAKSPLDNLFDELRERDPAHIALKYYDAYHSGSGKTLKSIQITLAARLDKFNLESVGALTITDELDLWKMGEEKTALFAIIPDNDTSFNFLVSILYTQLFQQLFEVADKKYGGTLPVHVQFLMDEFANVSLPDDFDKILSVMRSRGVSVSIILQNLAQLKALFEKQWESIVGNCDEFVYLGGNEKETHKYVSELLGKATIDTNSYGRSFGRSGNYTRNDQLTGRELLLPEEVRMLDNRFALLFIRGERPVMDLKYDLMRHPLVRMTDDGNAPSYIHGAALDAKSSIEIVWDAEPTEPIGAPNTSYELLSDEEVEELVLGKKKETTNPVLLGLPYKGKGIIYEEDDENDRQAR